MSLEPTLPFEFVVKGFPVSLQNRGRRALDAWKELVRSAYFSQLQEGHWAIDGALAVTIFYFPIGAMRGDVDNIVKPILDAMSGSLYIDDRQIERLLLRKFEPRRMLSFVDPSPALIFASEADRPILYVRIEGEHRLGAEVLT